MASISQITLPNGATYEVKDAGALTEIAQLRNSKADLENGKVPSSQLPVWDGSYLGGDAPPHEQWTFTLNDGTTVTKEVVLWPSST